MKRFLFLGTSCIVWLSLIGCVGGGEKPFAQTSAPEATPASIIETDAVEVHKTELIVESESEIADLDALARMGLKKLDLTKLPNTSSETIAALSLNLPGCQILWNQKFSDGVFRSDSTALTLPNATAEDIRLLDLFEALESVDCTGSTAFEALCAFAASHPDVDVRYSLTLGDTVLGNRDTELTVPAGADAETLKAALPYFPNLKSVDLRESELDDASLDALCALMKNVQVSRLISIGTARFDSDAASLDLREITDVSPDALIEKLKLFKALKTVAAPQGWTEEQTANLTKAFPDLTVAGAFSAFDRTFDGASDEIDLSGIKIADPAEVEAFLQKAPFLKKLDLSNCGLSDEQMAALCDAHSDVKFVWVIRIGPHKLRTDAIGFSTKNPSKHTNPNASADYNNKVKNTKRLFEGDIELLKYCTDLEALDLGHNYLTDNDLKVISGLTKLKILILADNKITDISALTSLKDLEYIELFMNKIPDLSPLTELKNLIDVNVCNTGVSDLSPLFELKSAKRLWYSMNPFDREQAKAVQEALPDCLCNYTSRDETGDGWREDPRYQWMRAYFR